MATTFATLSEIRVKDPGCGRRWLSVQGARLNPTRVVTRLDEDGYIASADPLWMADQKGEGIFDVVFVRYDGWTLAATFERARAAYDLWEGDWVAAVMVGSSRVLIFDRSKWLDLKDEDECPIDFESDLPDIQIG